MTLSPSLLALQTKLTAGVSDWTADMLANYGAAKVTGHSCRAVLKSLTRNTKSGFLAAVRSRRHIHDEVFLKGSTLHPEEAARC